MIYPKASKEELLKEKEKLQKEYKRLCGKGLNLDMSRGKPSKDQLDISDDMLAFLKNGASFTDEGTDVRNYGLLLGLPSCRRFFADLLKVPFENVIVGGNSSLSMIYDTMIRLWLFGAPDGKTPWKDENKVKWLCPVPGYDRHFSICEQLGIEMINIPMTDRGPDLNEIKKYASDPSVKGIWCVPVYSNPTGAVYSDETVKALASLKAAAPDFRIIWDNAYFVHHLTDEKPCILNIFDECKMAGYPNRPIIYTSTSKITYAGAGVAAMACSDDNIEWARKLMFVQTIGPNKINQFIHVKYFTEKTSLEEHMNKQAKLLKPKFDTVCNALDKELSGLGIASWTRPKGGYFISFNSYPGCAKRIYSLCKDAGVVLTKAGATFPHGIDPEDKNIRIAPSLPPVSDLAQAIEVFCVCVKLAALEKILG